MLKLIVLWLGALVFLALDCVGIGFCAYSLVLGRSTGWLDDTPLILFVKIIVGAFMGLLVAYLVLDARQESPGWSEE